MKETAKRVNVFPASNGISSVHSPSIPLGEPKPNCNEHSQHLLGECIQAGLSNKETNNNVEQTVDGVCLCLVGGASGGHDFVNLNTGKVMNRQTVTTIPMTDTVTQKVEEMAIAQGTTEIKFHNKRMEL